jgi:hypothetical protein
LWAFYKKKKKKLTNKTLDAFDEIKDDSFEFFRRQ